MIVFRPPGDVRCHQSLHQVCPPAARRARPDRFGARRVRRHPAGRGAEHRRRVAKKKLQVGILVDLPPFGVVNAKGGYEGYDVDVATLMAKYLGVELELVPVTGPNRIPYLLTSKVDVLVAIFGITPERARQVQFSIPYSSIDIALMAPKDRRSPAPADLKPLKVGVARASTQDTATERRCAAGHAHHALRRRRDHDRRRCCPTRSTRSA